MGKPHPNSLANLRPPWRRGQSGNPKGRPPREARFETLVESILDEPDPTHYPTEGADRRTKREGIARVLVDRLLIGDPRFWSLALPNLWPKALEIDLDVSGSIEVEDARERLLERVARLRAVSDDPVVDEDGNPGAS